MNSRWPDYLSSCKKDKDKLFALVSLEMHEKVINYLIDRNEYKFASLYADVCIEYKLTDNTLYNLFKKVYQKYIDFLSDANLQYLIPCYQHRINYLEAKVDKFKMNSNEQTDKKTDYLFKKGYLKDCDVLNVLAQEESAIEEADEESVCEKKEEAS